MSYGAPVSNVSSYNSPTLRPAGQPPTITPIGEPVIDAGLRKQYTVQQSPNSAASWAYGHPASMGTSQGPFAVPQPTGLASPGASHVATAPSGHAAGLQTPIATGPSVNLNFVKSWQGAVRIAKAVTALVCLVSLASVLTIPCTLFGTCVVSSGHAYALAVAVIAFIFNCGWFSFYLFLFNSRWPVATKRAVTVYNCVELLFIVAAVICASGLSFYTQSGCTYSTICNLYSTYNSGIQAYVAFGLFFIIGCSIDLYLTFAWWKGGQELVPLPLTAVKSPQPIVQQHHQQQPQPLQQQQQQQVEQKQQYNQQQPPQQQQRLEERN